MKKKCANSEVRSTDATTPTLYFSLKKKNSSTSTSPSLSVIFCYKPIAFSVEFSFGPVSGYGTVSPTCSVTALLLVAKTDLLTLAFALPKPRSLEDLLHELFKGTLDAIFGLCTGLCAKEGVSKQQKSLNTKKEQNTLRSANIQIQYFIFFSFLFFYLSKSLMTHKINRLM